MRSTKGSPAIRSSTRSKWRMSEAKTCTTASASPVTVDADTTSGYRSRPRLMSFGEVLWRQKISTKPSVSQPSAAGSTRTVNPVMAPSALSRSTLRLTAGAERPTACPMSA